MTPQTVEKTSTITFKHRLLAVAMMALMVSHAEAATLKSEALVAGANLTVGDLFEGDIKHADYALAPAPAPGKTMVLRARDLSRVATTFGIDWKPETGAEQITISSAQASVDRSELLAALTSAAGDDMIELQLPENLAALSIPANATAALNVESISINEDAQTFTARVALPAHDGGTRIETVHGRAFTMVSVPVLKNAIKAGEVISSADIEYVTRRKDSVASNALVDEAQLVGMSPRRTAAAGKPLQANDLEAPMLVRKGQTVTVTLNSGAIALSLQGRAMQNGGTGDTIRILNPASNQVVEATVTGLQSVAVMPPAPTELN